jgi:hypothetical protein
VHAVIKKPFFRTNLYSKDQQALKSGLTELALNEMLAAFRNNIMQVIGLSKLNLD